MKFVYTFFTRRAIFGRLLVLILIIGWIFSGWPQIWQNPRIPPDTEHAFALNKTNNWNFNGNSTGWTATNGTANGTASTGTTCGSTADVTTNNMATFTYNGALSGQTAFGAISGAVKNTDYRGNINQTVAALGSGTVKVKGKFSYYGNSTAWGTGKVSLELWNSSNSTFVADLGCVTMSANTAWTTTAFSSNASLTGGITYTIRVNLVAKTKSNSNTAITVGVDNIVVNFAPTGLSVSAPVDTTNTQLDWTTSVAGTGANGLNVTTPYKVYRDISSPVSTFKDNSSTNSFTDSSTAGNTTYYYAISDVDTASEESPLSAEVSILTRPGSPTMQAFTNIQATTLTVNWTAPTGGAGALTYKVYRCEGASCTPSEIPIASGVAALFYNDPSLTCNTLYRYRVRATNATPADGAYSSIADQTTSACGSITVDIVNASYVSVGSPTMAMNSATFSLICQTATGSFGTTLQQIYVNNNDAADGGWIVNLAASNPTDVWDSAGTDFDFNEAGTGGCVDDGATTDADSLGGQMTVDPSGGTLNVGQCGSCSVTGVSLGTQELFIETTNNDIDIVTGAIGSDDIGDWRVQGVSISQKIPKEQPVANDYDINMVLTITTL